MRTFPDFHADLSKLCQGVVRKKTWTSKPTEHTPQRQNRVGFAVSYTGNDAATLLEADKAALQSNDYEVTEVKHRGKPSSLLVEIFLSKYPG